MSDNTYLLALQKIAAGTLQVGELVEAASRLSAGGQPDPARQLYRVWIKSNPNHPLLYVVLFNCSALDSALGDMAAATEALKSAISVNADFMPAYINLGGILERAGGPDRAIELWQTGLKRPAVITGNSVSYATTALKQVARVLSDQQKVEAAEAAVQQCLEINPLQGDIVEQYVALRLAQCKWPTISSSERVDRRQVIKGIHPLSMAVYTDDPLLQLAGADRYVKNSNAEGVYSESADRRHAPINLKSRRLKVGYVSSDLRDHAVGYLMAEFFEVHRGRNIEVFAYYCGPETNSALTTRIKASVEHWTDIRSLSDEDAAKKIAADGIDILVDVNGHTRDARLGVFARRPAPILVNWLGYPGTMGTPYHHYVIADDWIIPEGSEQYYSEKVLRLPCYQPNDRKRVVAERKPARSEVGLPENAFVYCSFNGTHKISRFTFERWMDVLKRVPDSVLWLLDASGETKARLAKYAADRGVAGERLVFAPKIQNAHHLARYELADLFLDTAPYGAHTTASDALWMGVPVLTLSGKSFASRVCGSLVRAAGLKDLVFTKPEQYVERAVALGKNRPQVQVYRKKLKKGRSSSLLFDMALLVKSLEALYGQMCREHKQGRLPVPNLENLNSYLEAGVEHDHEGQEMLALSGYHELYKAKLQRMHLARPMRADGRLWTEAEIKKAGAVKVQKSRVAPVKRVPPVADKRKRVGAR